MNWLDRTVGWISPEAGVRRARARAALAVVRAYEGASIGRRTSGWKTSTMSANNEIASALPRLRARSRDLVRNNPYARRAIAALVGNAVGVGITLGIKDAGPAKVWKQWAAEADFYADTDLYGLQAMIARAVFESGDCLVVRSRVTMSEAGRSGVPLRLKVLEGDYLDSAKERVETGGNKVVAGIELDAQGRRVAFWLFPEHPNDTMSRRQQSVRVPAEDVIYAFEKERPGQALGVPRLSSAIMRARDLDEYQDALLVKKKIEACFTMAVSNIDGEGPGVAGSGVGTALETETDADGNSRRIERMSPGLIIYNKPGESVTFGQPSAVADTGYTADQLRAIAMGSGCTYEQLSGDLSRVNYSSMRGGRAEFKILIEQFRWLSFIPQVMERIYGWFEEAASFANRIRSTQYDHTWTPPRWEYVNPLEDVKADMAELGACLASPSEKLRERGYDPKVVLEEIAADRKTMADLDIQPVYGPGGGAAAPAAAPAADSNADKSTDEPA